MRFSRQEYWSRLPFPSSGESSQSRDRTCSSVSPSLQVNSLPDKPLGKPRLSLGCINERSRNLKKRVQLSKGWAYTSGSLEVRVWMRPERTLICWPWPLTSGRSCIRWNEIGNIKGLEFTEGIQRQSSIGMGGRELGRWETQGLFMVWDLGSLAAKP